MRNVSLIVLGVVVALGVGIGVAVGSSSDGSAHVVSGSLEVFSDSGCNLGETGYADIREGTPVTLKDAKGNIVGSSALDPGTPNSSNNSCVFAYSLGKVKLNSPFYAVTIGRRGDVSFTKDQIIQNDYQLGTNLGTNQTGNGGVPS